LDGSDARKARDSKNSVGVVTTHSKKSSRLQRVGAKRSRADFCNKIDHKRSSAGFAGAGDFATIDV
jgi:hypothetical protein